VAVSLVGSKSFTYSTVGGGDSISLTDLGASLQQNDVVYIVLSTGQKTSNSTASMAVSGYTALASLYANDNNDTNLVVQRKVMGATPDTSFTTPTLSSSRFIGQVFAFRGVDTTTPEDVAVTTATGTNSNLANPPAITPTTAGAWIFVAYSASKTTNTNWTAPSPALTAFIQNGSDFTHSGAGYYSGWSSGPYDPAAATGGTDNVADSWCAATVALRPATVTHATTGVLTGQIGSVAGSAAHIAVHPTSGTLTGQIGSVSGAAAHVAVHGTSGILTGQLGSVSGAATRFRAFATSGALTGQLGSVSGTAVYNAKHTTSGILAGQGSSLSGSAARFRAFASSGGLTGPGAAISGTSARTRAHATSGILAGLDSSISGAALHPTAHAATGVLEGQGSVLIGLASRDSLRAISRRARNRRYRRPRAYENYGRVGP
jgi:hypothetical protein